jgi:putative transposase
MLIPGYKLQTSAAPQGDARVPGFAMLIPGYNRSRPRPSASAEGCMSSHRGRARLRGMHTPGPGQPAPTRHFFTAALEDECSSALTEHADTLRLAFRACRDRYPFELMAGVILPDHLHCILALPTGDTSHAQRCRLIQALFERVVGGPALWRGFEDQPLRDEAEVQRQVDYIHADPVRHGLVRSPRKWQFSSLHAYIEHGLRPLHWSGDVEAGYGARRN